MTVHPRRRDWLRSLRLTDPEHFLGMGALIVSGHPGRQVGRVVLGDGPVKRTLYLKREQGVRATTRLLNFLSGFGWVSRSVREAQLLEALERDDLPGPRWLATGEDATGRAFLLVEEVAASSSLTAALEARPAAHGADTLAARLGATLARLHEAGFFHRDLYAKHVLVGDATGEVCLLDWQRAWRGAWIPHSSRSATWRVCMPRSPTIWPDRERFAFCATSARGLAGRPCAGCWRRWRRWPGVCGRGGTSARARQPPTAEQQAWICLDGQALCITPGAGGDDGGTVAGLPGSGAASPCRPA